MTTEPECDEAGAPPSGPWQGFFLQRPRRVRMDLDLSFQSGRITGGGSDAVGLFRIHGRYDAERVCRWVKTYPGSHDVHYRGFWERGVIWGTWEILGAGLAYVRGGFEIWPRGLGSREVLRAEADAPAPVPMPTGTVASRCPPAAGPL